MEKSLDDSCPDMSLLQLLEISLTKNDFELNEISFSGTAMGKNLHQPMPNLGTNNWHIGKRLGFKNVPNYQPIIFRWLDN